MDKIQSKINKLYKLAADIGSYGNGMTIRKALNVLSMQDEFDYFNFFFKHRLRKSNKHPDSLHNLLYKFRKLSTISNSFFFVKHWREDNICRLKPHKDIIKDVRVHNRDDKFMTLQNKKYDHLNKVAKYWIRNRVTQKSDLKEIHSNYDLSEIINTVSCADDFLSDNIICHMCGEPNTDKHIL